MQIVNNVLNNQKSVSNTQAVNSVVQVANAVAANSSNNKKEYIRLLSNISNKINTLLNYYKKEQ